MKATIQILCACGIVLAAIPIFCVVLPIVWLGDQIKLLDDCVRNHEPL